MTKTHNGIRLCRICEGEFNPAKLDLGLTCIANELYKDRSQALIADKFNLSLVLCNQCKHFQLDTVIDKQRLYSNYLYATGISSQFQLHFERLAENLAIKYPTRKKVIEIGSNDGTLLSKLTQKGFSVLGIEPSEELAKQTKKMGIEVLNGFIEECWPQVLEKYGKFDIAVGNNVFAHIEDLNLAIKSTAEVLDDDGILVFEVAYFPNLVECNLLDTIYHEHLSYHTLNSLKRILECNKLHMFDVEEIETHGGSIRVFASKKYQESSIKLEQMLILETILGFMDDTAIHRLQRSVSLVRESVRLFLDRYPQDFQFFGYGAPAKVVTFLALVPNLATRIHSIVDDNVLKQGKFLPETGLPIISKHEFEGIVGSQEEKNITVINFAWNLDSDIVNNLLEIPAKSISVVTFLPKLSVRVVK